jgi:GWxTD domain-containing protein
LKSILSHVVARVLIVISLSPLAFAADRSRDLPQRYQHWLNEEVKYIIDGNERKQFLSLASDSERESFIAAFWRIRSQDPDSETNAYRDEHYRRMAYANEHFGSIGTQNGWRTDQGHIYVVLGPPKQLVTYPATRNVRPMEIWFYQSPSLALPSYFSLIFYKRSIGEPYSLYSPNQDGPARLVSSLEALNDQKKSLDILRKSLGDEVAKTALSLIPGESVSLDEYQPTLSSDLLLGLIEGLPDNPITKEALDANRLRDHVSTSILTGEAAPELGYAIFRDDQGRETVSYLLRFQEPTPGLIGPGPEKTLGYDLTLRTSVLTADGVSAYQQEEQLTGRLTEAQAEIAKKKRFAAECRLPLSPGKYNLVVTLTNNMDQTATRQHALITVPPPTSQTVGLSPLMAHSGRAALPDPGNSLPFSVSGIRFTPRGAQTVYLSQGERLPLVFQLWLGPKAAGSADTAKIHVHYVFGTASTAHESPSEEDEEIDSTNRDAAGNLLTGHTVDTSGLTPGTYRLVVGANMDGTHQTAYESLTLRVEPSADRVATWTAYGAPEHGGQALDDLKRGLSAEAQGKDEEAQSKYAKALGEGVTDIRALDRLVALLQRLGKDEELAALSQQPVLSHSAAAPKTLLAIANALTNRGNPKSVVSLLEVQIRLQPPSVDLYKALANACEVTGDPSRARELRVLASGVN